MDAISIYLCVAVAISSAMFLIKNKWINFSLFLPAIVSQFCFLYFAYNHRGEFFLYYFKIDTIGVIFIGVISILYVFSVFHTYLYDKNRQSSAHQIMVHNSVLVMFITAMSCALVADHLGLLWALLEATTVCSAILIYFDRSNISLEAAWKYFFVCSIGLALAYVGILFLGIAGQAKEHLDISVSLLSTKSHELSPIWLKISFLFAIVGFSVKMGAAPLFSVDIDAKDTAPSPIGALFSGGLMNVGFVALFRFYEIFSLTEIKPWMDKIILIMGVASIFFAAVYLLKVKNVKRLLAYSSLEHIGIALIALASGGIGYMAAVLHLIIHSFVKAGLFYQIGLLYRTYQDKDIMLHGEYFKNYPTGAVIVLVGFLCMMSIPPSALFLTEFYTFSAVFKSYHWFIGVAVLLLLTVIFYALTKSMIQILFASMLPMQTVHEKVQPWESISQYILFAFVIWMGLSPAQPLLELASEAVKHLPK